MDVRPAYDRSPKIARYLAKYLGKSYVGLPFGARAYSAFGSVAKETVIASDGLLEEGFDLSTWDAVEVERVDRYNTRALGVCVKKIYKKKNYVIEN